MRGVAVLPRGLEDKKMSTPIIVVGIVSLLVLCLVALMLWD